jgi:hypothetical protein
LPSALGKPIRPFVDGGFTPLIPDALVAGRTFHEPRLPPLSAVCQIELRYGEVNTRGILKLSDCVVGATVPSHDEGRQIPAPFTS